MIGNNNKWDKKEFLLILKYLKINQSSLSKLMGVNVRTVRRWVSKPEIIPCSVRECITAWIKLKELGNSWMTESMLDKLKLKIKCKKCGAIGRFGTIEPFSEYCWNCVKSDDWQMEKIDNHDNLHL